MTLFASAGNPAKFVYCVADQINCVDQIKSMQSRPPAHLCYSFQFPTASPSLGHSVILSDDMAYATLIGEGRMEITCAFACSSCRVDFSSCEVAEFSFASFVFSSVRKLCKKSLQKCPVEMIQLSVNIITWFLSSSSWQVFSARATSCRRPPSSLWSSSFCNTRN